MIKAFIFDLYGVIGADQSHIAVRHLTNDIEKIEECRAILHSNDLGIITEVEVNAGIAETLEVSIEEWCDILAKSGNKDKRLLDYILSLKSSYKTGLITNAGVDSIKQFFSKEELELYFDCAVISGEVGYVKPDPKIYQLCLDGLELEGEDCLYIDDREEYCTSAIRLGMKSILYTSYGDFIHKIKDFL